MKGRIISWDAAKGGPISATSVWLPGEARSTVSIADVDAELQQTNVLRRHGDGTIATAVSTWFEGPNAGRLAEFEFVPDGTPSGTPAPLLRVNPSILADVGFGVELITDDGRAFRTWIGPESGLRIAKTAILSDRFSTWHRGTVMEEVQYRLPLVDLEGNVSPVVVVARWRLFGASYPGARIELAFENGRFATQEEPVFRRLKVLKASGEKYVLEDGIFYVSTRFRYSWWVGEEPADRIAFPDPEELVERLLVPPLNLATPFSEEGAETELRHKIAGLDEENLDGRPFASGPVYSYMPGTGDRMDIGWIPNWGVVALQSTSRAAWTVLRQADRNGIGAFPMWPRAKDSNYSRFLRPSDPDVTKGATINWRGPAENPNVADYMHHPDVGWLSFLTRGAEVFDAETLEGSSTYSTLIRWPYRERIYESKAGTREGSWTLRTLNQAAAFLPISLPNVVPLYRALQDSLDYFEENRTTHPLHFWSRGNDLSRPPTQSGPIFQNGWWGAMLRACWAYTRRQSARRLFEFTVEKIVEAFRDTIPPFLAPDGIVYEWRPTWLMAYRVPTTVYMTEVDGDRVLPVAGTERDIESFGEVLYYRAVGESNKLAAGEVPPEEWDGLAPEDWRIAAGYDWRDPGAYWLVFAMEELAPLLAKFEGEYSLWRALLPYLRAERDRGVKPEAVWLVPGPPPGDEG